MKSSTLQVRTPEGIVFSQTLAGPIARFLAWLLDFVCTAAVVIALQMLVKVVTIITPDVGTAISLALYFIVPMSYAIVLEWFWRGQTIGKRVLRIRVVDADGLRLRFSQIVLRNLLRIVDSPVAIVGMGTATVPLPTFYPVGGLVCFFTNKAQRLGDLAASTVVVRIPRITEPNLEQLLPDKFNSLRAYPHLEARLRQRVTPAEASIALQSLVRRDEFDPVARVQLFGDLAAHFKSKVEFPTEATEGMPDEQYVRNVVDVLYRAGTDRKRAASTAQNSGASLESRQDADGTLVA